MTNYDCIKKLGPNKLAAFLSLPFYSYVECKHDCENKEYNSECITCILEWLNKEVKK